MSPTARAVLFLVGSILFVQWINWLGERPPKLRQINRRYYPTPSRAYVPPVMSMNAAVPEGRWADETVVMNAAGKVLARHRRCQHVAADVVPVETGGEVVAHLCTNCDEQLPAEWSS